MLEPFSLSLFCAVQCTSIMHEASEFQQGDIVLPFTKYVATLSPY